MAPLHRSGFVAAAACGIVVLMGSCATEPENACGPGAACAPEGSSCQMILSECAGCVCTNGHFVCDMGDCPPREAGAPIPPTISASPNPLWLVAGETTPLDVVLRSALSLSGTISVSVAGLPANSSPVFAHWETDGAYHASVPLAVSPSAAPSHWPATVTATFTIAGNQPSSVSAPLDAYVTDAAGSLDPSFGDHGCVAFPFVPLRVRAFADGTAIVGGSVLESGKLEVDVVRLLADGSVDSLFANSGALVIPNATVYSLDVDANREIAFTFEADDGTTTTDELAIAGADGNSSTVVPVDIGSVAWHAGSVVVAGRHAISTVDTNAQVVTYGLPPLSFGADPPLAGFGADGSVFFPTWTCDNTQPCTTSVTKFALQSPGNYALDSSFGNGGVTKVTGVDSTYGGTGIAVDPSNEILISFSKMYTTGKLARVGANGGALPTIDMPQSGGPLVFEPLSRTTLVTGAVPYGTGNELIVSRFDVAGQIDATFGYEGMIGLGTNASCTDAALDGAGHLYVVTRPNVSPAAGLVCRIRL